MLSRHSVGKGNELTRNSSGKARPQSSHFDEPLWTGPGIKSNNSDNNNGDLYSALTKISTTRFTIAMYK